MSYEEEDTCMSYEEEDTCGGRPCRLLCELRVVEGAGTLRSLQRWCLSRSLHMSAAGIVSFSRAPFAGVHFAIELKPKPEPAGDRSNGPTRHHVSASDR